MNIDSDIACRDAITVKSRIQRRWTMNFAAAVSDSSPCYYGNGGRALVAHPLFHAHLEWRLKKLIMLRTNVPRRVQERAVHAGQYLWIGRLFRAGEIVITRGAVIGAEPSRSGVRLTTRFDTWDGCGERVSTAIAVTVYRGVGLVGPPVVPPDLPSLAGQLDPVPPPRCRSQVLALDRGVAHTYGECARIWNPVHTDVTVAQRVGLPGAVMHGSGLLAMAVSDVIKNEGNGDPATVSTVNARFRAPLVIPHLPTLHVSVPAHVADTDQVRFWLVREDQVPAMTGICTMTGAAC